MPIILGRKCKRCGKDTELCNLLIVSAKSRASTWEEEWCVGCYNAVGFIWDGRAYIYFEFAGDEKILHWYELGEEDRWANEEVIDDFVP